MTPDLKGFIAKRECVQKGFMASNATRDVLAIIPTLSGTYVLLYTSAGTGHKKALGKTSVNYTYSLFSVVLIRNTDIFSTSQPLI